MPIMQYSSDWSSKLLRANGHHYSGRYFEPYEYVSGNSMALKPPA